MRVRIVVALVAASALTAFAPAPIPRPRRGSEEGINLAKFQGEWRSLGLQVIGVNGEKSTINWGVTSIKVVGAQWTFMFGDQKNAEYVLVIDGSKRPATIDFYSGTKREQSATPYMVGLIKREGNRVTILYFSTTADKRATSFESPPQGWWLLTLEKMG